jgi:hypothetical protein
LKPEEHPLTRNRLLAASAAGILFLTVAYWVRTWDSFATLRDICPRLFCDFSDYYYPMGDAVFRTGVPVDGFLYSPLIAILLAVFPPVGHETSLVLWGILQCLFVSLYLLLGWRVLRAPRSIQLLFPALLFCTYPLLVNVMGGQVSVFIMVPLLGMLAMDERDRPVAAAGLLALAVSFKFYPLIFLWLFVARRDARGLLLGAAACGTALFVVPCLFLGAGGTLAFYGGLLEQFRDSGWVVINTHSQFFPHVVNRLTGGDAPLLPLHLISYSVAGANLALVFLVQRARMRHADLWSFLILLLTIPFILKTSWPHDFVFLPFTQAFLAWQLIERRATVPGPSTGLIWVLLLGSIAFSNVIFFHLFAFGLYGYFAFVFWANLLLLIASYVLLLPTSLRRPRPASGELAGNAG